MSKSNPTISVTFTREQVNEILTNHALQIYGRDMEGKETSVEYTVDGNDENKLKTIRVDISDKKPSAGGFRMA